MLYKMFCFKALNFFFTVWEHIVKISTNKKLLHGWPVCFQFVLVIRRVIFCCLRLQMHQTAEREREKTEE